MPKMWPQFTRFLLSSATVMVQTHWQPRECVWNSECFPLYLLLQGLSLSHCAQVTTKHNTNKSHFDTLSHTNTEIHSTSIKSWMSYSASKSLCTWDIKRTYRLQHAKRLFSHKSCGVNFVKLHSLPVDIDLSSQLSHTRLWWSALTITMMQGWHWFNKID